MPTEKRKIIFVHPDLGIGGAERLILDIANSLKDEYEITFLTNHFDRNHCFDDLKQGYNVQVIGDWLPRSLYGKCQALCAYFRMIYLIVTFLLFTPHEASLFFTDLIPLANPFLKLAGKKVIYYCHHPDLLATDRATFLKRFYRIPLDWIEMKATSYSDVILVNSEYTASIFKKTFPEISINTKVLYPTVANSFIENLNTVGDEPENKLPDNLMVFLSINRFHPAKKLDMAVNALNILKMEKPEVYNKIILVMAGGYDPVSKINQTYFNELKELTQHCEVSDKVVFIKSPSDEEKCKLLKRCDCLIYTPVKEHFGIVPLEAMLAGKPVLACDSGGPRETVKHGVTGYLCEPNHVSMADYIFKLTNENLASMGFAGKQRVARKFSNEKFTADIKKIVRKNISE